MTLNQAFALINSRTDAAPRDIYYLVCGFEPLHLATLLKAHLLDNLPGSVELTYGVYGDFCGSLQRASNSNALAAAVVLEWSDIDPRLGLRSSGGWTTESKFSILADAKRKLAGIEVGLEQLGARMPVVLAAPSLPLPPIGNTASPQRSLFELELHCQLASFLLSSANLPGVRVVEIGQFESALDARMELMAGFPYKLPLASALAQTLAQAISPPEPKKGLITDLDDTLWHGIVGEIGHDAISWSQDSHTQTHGLYQQMLASLAGAGVLLAICSKNERDTVDAALGRNDLFFPTDLFFPIAANWGTKSSNIKAILATWNIAANSVVFVDDNQMELEEVRQTFPGITTLQFKGKDAASVWALLQNLKDLFGKTLILDEDRIRSSSIRNADKLRVPAGSEAGSPEFLRTLDGLVSFDWSVDPKDKRPLELINKTNQFNLNGRRIAEGVWSRILGQPNTVLCVASYGDKFGRVGKIAAVLGTVSGSTVDVSHWVMSCRSFSRRIEHHTLEAVFHHSGAQRIRFAFQTSDRNQPLREFLSSLHLSATSDGDYILTQEHFLQYRGELPHAVSGLQ